MKLTIESVAVSDVQFGEKTLFKDGVMYINKEDILAFLQEEPCIDTLKLDIAYPGESVRLVNVVDIVQPRCKIEGGIDWPGVLTDDFQIVGNGVTRSVEGMGIVMCQNNTYWNRFWGTFDMSGPYSDVNPFAMMPELVIEPIAPNADFRDYREALRRIAFKTGIMIAKATLHKAAEKIEVFDNETINPELPNVVYSCQIYSKQYNTLNYMEPMFYGTAVPDTLPLVIQPTEFLDGALSSCGGYRNLLTYEIQNNAVVKELYKYHGKDFNFVGSFITVTSVEARRRHLAAVMVANIAKEQFDADGIIITKGTGGASTIDVGDIASECEKLGIKAVPIIQVLNDQSNLSTECLFDASMNVDSIVQIGAQCFEFDLPAVEKVLGNREDAMYITPDALVENGHTAVNGPPAKGPVTVQTFKTIHLLSQLGAAREMGVDY